MMVIDWHAVVLEICIWKKGRNLEYKDVGQGNVSNAVNQEQIGICT